MKTEAYSIHVDSARRERFVSKTLILEHPTTGKQVDAHRKSR